MESPFLTRADSPGVFYQQGLDKVNCQGGDPLECVLRVVYVDLGNVQERLLLFVPQKGGLARQHDVSQNPDAPVRENKKVKMELQNILRPPTHSRIQLVT